MPSKAAGSKARKERSGATEPSSQSYGMISPGHSMCAGCGVAIAVNLVSRAAPKNIVVSNATSCLEVTTSMYPRTAWNVPWAHCAFETASSVASGMEAAIKHMDKDWKVMAIAGDGGTFDIGFQALSGMMERGHKVTQVCVDNECYANCLSLSTTVMTSEGLKRITEIKKGDNLYVFDMKKREPALKKCTGVFDNGVKDVYDFGTLHHMIRATKNHPFLTLKRTGRRKENELTWKTLGELRIGDFIVVMKHLDMNRSHDFSAFKKSKKGDYKVNKINYVELPKKSSPELMEYLGLFVGDGWVRVNRAETGFSIPEGTSERSRLMDLHSRIFKSGISRIEKNDLLINSINIAKFIDHLGFGKGAKNKTIPDWVFALPRSEKEAFVKGLVASDGYYAEDNSIRFISSSKRLLKRLRLLLQTMGYRVGKIHWRKTKKGTFVVYRKLLKDTASGYICFSKRKEWNIEKYPSQYKHQNFLIGNEHFEMEKVNYKKHIGKEPTLDLRVEGEHNFIADGIVVHNTGVQRSGATPYGAWTTTSPVGKESIGKQQFKKPIAEIIAAHKIPYVASASIAYPTDLIGKARKAFENQPSFLHIHSPCPTGWKFGTADTVKISRLAVETGMWVLYEIEDGHMKITRRITKKKPVGEYLKIQGRFKHLQEADVKVIQKHVDSENERLEKIEKSGIRL
jgi:pyruvate/2-oxoacid:ferredoxin oxidoreductase beta subunit